MNLRVKAQLQKKEDIFTHQAELILTQKGNTAPIYRNWTNIQVFVKSASESFQNHLTFPPFECHFLLNFSHP